MRTEATFTVDTTLHEVEAVKRLCYSLSDVCSSEIKRTDGDRLQVVCRSLGGTPLPAGFAARFENGLIDFGIRATLSRETASIRDLIFRQAFVEADL
jgi:His-Xaa-Ser system protein HxsD